MSSPKQKVIPIILFLNPLTQNFTRGIALSPQALRISVLSDALQATSIMTWIR